MHVDPDVDAVPYYFNGRPVYIDRNGEPMSVRDWSLAFSDATNRTLAWTAEGDSEVITMWMGMDSDPMHHPVPLIFGSIIKSHGVFSDEIETATEAEALEAHQKLVDLLTWRARTDE